MKFSPTATFAAGAVMALVIGSGTAVAATGGKFLLGKSNSATSPTSLKNSKGSALLLSSKAGTPSLRVSNSVRVPALNADLIDGLDSRSLALAGGQTNTVQATGFPIDVNNDGTNDFLAATVSCPAGTKLTGGGGDDYTANGSLFVNSPLNKQTWSVTSTSSDLSDPTDVVAYAVCYNPRGGVPGGSFRTSHATLDSKALALLKHRLAPKVH